MWPTAIQCATILTFFGKHHQANADTEIYICRLCFDISLTCCFFFKLQIEISLFFFFVMHLFAFLHMLIINLSVCCQFRSFVGFFVVFAFSISNYYLQFSDVTLNEFSLGKSTQTRVEFRPGISKVLVLNEDFLSFIVYCSNDIIGSA